MFFEKDKCNDAFSDADSLINISSLIDSKYFLKRINAMILVILLRSISLHSLIDSKCFLKRISDVCDSLINISSFIDSKCFLKRINAMMLVIL